MTAIDKLTDERAAFEAWAAENNVCVNGTDGDYVFRDARCAWAAWQARALLAGAAEGWRMVPVMPTQEMLDAADKVIDADPIWIARAYRAMLIAAPGAAAAESTNSFHLAAPGTSGFAASRGDAKSGNTAANTAQERPL